MLEWILCLIGCVLILIGGFAFGFAAKSKDVLTKLRERGWKIEPPDIEEEVKK